MLVLSIDMGEEVTINGPCVIKPVRGNGASVRLGFIADRSTDIVRKSARKRKDESLKTRKQEWED